MIEGSVSILSPSVPAVSPAVTFLAGPTGPSAYQVAVAAGFTGTAAQWLASLIGPGATLAQVQAAVQGLLGVASGIAQLDASGRQMLAQDQIRAWQVSRAARPILVAAGGFWSAFLASAGATDPDAAGGAYEAVQSGTPAPVAGVLSGLISTYLVTVLGQSSGQAAASIAAIWAAAVTITP